MSDDLDFFTEMYESAISFNKMVGFHYNYSLQLSFIEEEVDEILTAKNDKEMLKEICDLFFVGAYGFRLVGDGGVESMIQDALNNSYLFPENTSFDLFLENLQSYKSRMSDREVLEGSFAASIIMLKALGLDYKKALCEVCENNITKLSTVADYSEGGVINQELIDAEAKEIEKNSDGRYDYVVGVVVEDRVIFISNNGEGKVLKPLKYKPVNTETW